MVEQRKGDIGQSAVAQEAPSIASRGSLPEHLEAQLADALQRQVEAHAAQRPFATSELLRQFPSLVGHNEAELCLAYQEISLQPEEASAAARVKSAYPHLADDLTRQIEFARALAMYSNGSAAIDFGTLPTLSDKYRNVANPASFPSPGQIGRFTIERLVGHGGMGVVFCAYDTLLRRRVAIKIPKTDLVDAVELDRRLVREARIAAQLRHPNLAELYEVAQFEGGHYLVSRWANGGTLQQYLGRRNTPVPEQAALQLLVGIVSGLEHCHQRSITHLDLKPGNILFDNQGTLDEASSCTQEQREFPGRPLVTDFGIARVLDPGVTLSCTHTGVGTPLYMSPEQIDGRQGAVGPASDIFALGLILHEMLGGRHPLADQPISRAFRLLANADIPRLSASLGISTSTLCLLARCLQPDPNDRYPDASALLRDLQKIQRGEVVSAGTWAPYARLRAWTQREEAIDQAAYVTIGLNIGVFVGFALMLLSVALRWSNDFVGSPSELAIDILKLVVFPHLPLVFICVCILRGQKWLHIVNTALSAMLFLMIFYALVTGVSPVRLYHDRPFAHYLIHLTIFGVFFYVLVAHLIALPAWLRLRKPANSKVSQGG